jgi:Ras-related protein Rab-7A
MSTGSAVTMTPSLFARERTAAGNTASTTPEADPFLSPAVPSRGPKLFFTSAKTGKGVAEVFEYIAQRVVKKVEYDDRIESHRMHAREASVADTIRLGLKSGKWRQDDRWTTCCGT